MKRITQKQARAMENDELVYDFAHSSVREFQALTAKRLLPVGFDSRARDAANFYCHNAYILRDEILRRLAK